MLAAAAVLLFLAVALKVVVAQVVAQQEVITKLLEMLAQQTQAVAVVEQVEIT
jgi:hypothetical protein